MNYDVQSSILQVTYMHINISNIAYCVMLLSWFCVAMVVHTHLPHSECKAVEFSKLWSKSTPSKQTQVAKNI